MGVCRYCPYCKGAKNLFTKLKVPFDAVELDTVKGGDALQDELEAVTSQSTVPNVFVAGQHVGGFDKTKAALASGKLLALLKSVGITPAQADVTEASKL